MTEHLAWDPDEVPPDGRYRRSRGAVGALLAGLVTIMVGLVMLQQGLARSQSSPQLTGVTGGSASGTPASGGLSPTSTVAPSAVAPTASGAAAARYVFPVLGSSTYGHTHHDYPATDIFAPCATPVVAVTSGVVLETSLVDTFDPAVNAGATRGGLSVTIIGDDGVRYYSSHLSKVDSAITPGVRVAPGQRIGAVGDTGSASACHLHVGFSPPCLRLGDWWTRRGAVWPWPYLDSWRRHRFASPVAEVAAWQAAHGCPTSPLAYP